MRATQEMLDAAWAEMKRVSMIPNMDTKEKLEYAINAALAKLHPPADAMVVEAHVVGTSR